MSLKISTKGLILLGLPVTVQLGSILALFLVVGHAKQDIDHANRAVQTTALIESVSQSVVGSATTLVAYQKMRSPFLSQRLDALQDKLPKDLSKLDELTADDKEQQGILRHIKLLADRCQMLLMETRQSIELHQSALPFLDNEEGRAEIENLLGALMHDTHTFVSNERVREQQLAQKSSQSCTMVANVMSFGVVANVVVIGAMSILFYKGIAGRLSVLRTNTRLMTSGKQLKPPLVGNDEIAEVDHTFHEMAKALIETDRLKQQFLQMISHDLRSPLSSVMAVLEFLEDGLYGDLSDEALKDIRGATSNVQRVVALISQLLDMEKAAAGQLDLDLEEQHLAFLFDDAVQAVQPLANNKKIRIETCLPDLYVTADSMRIVQVLINLLSNAIKFSPRDSVITLASSLVDEETVEITVSDLGRGIPEELQATVFERFSQVQRDDKRAGSGLGLAICKSIVENHGGTIGVRNNDQIGTTFWIKLKGRTEPVASSEGDVVIESSR